MTGSHPSWSTLLRYCFIFFLVSKSTHLKYYIIYHTHTSEVHTSSKKRGISPPQNESQAELYPPIFITAHTPPVHGGV